MSPYRHGRAIAAVVSTALTLGLATTAAAQSENSNLPPRPPGQQDVSHGPPAPLPAKVTPDPALRPSPQQAKGETGKVHPTDAPPTPITPPTPPAPWA